MGNTELSPLVKKFVVEYARLDPGEKVRINEKLFELNGSLGEITEAIESPSKEAGEGCMVIRFGGFTQTIIDRVKASITEELPELNGTYLYELADVVEELHETVMINEPYFTKLPKLREYMKDLSNQVLVKLEAMSVLNTLIDLMDDPEDDEIA